MPYPLQVHANLLMQSTKIGVFARLRSTRLQYCSILIATLKYRQIQYTAQVAAETLEKELNGKIKELEETVKALSVTGSAAALEGEAMLDNAPSAVGALQDKESAPQSLDQRSDLRVPMAQVRHSPASVIPLSCPIKCLRIVSVLLKRTSRKLNSMQVASPS